MEIEVRPGGRRANVDPLFRDGFTGERSSPMPDQSTRADEITADYHDRIQALVIVRIVSEQPTTSRSPSWSATSPRARRGNGSASPRTSNPRSPTSLPMVSSTVPGRRSARPARSSATSDWIASSKLPGEERRIGVPRLQRFLPAWHRRALIAALLARHNGICAALSSAALFLPAAPATGSIQAKCKHPESAQAKARNR